MLQNYCYFSKVGVKEMVIIQKARDRIVILWSHLINNYHLFNIFFSRKFLSRADNYFVYFVEKEIGKISDNCHFWAHPIAKKALESIQHSK